VKPLKSGASNEVVALVEEISEFQAIETEAKQRGYSAGMPMPQSIAKNWCTSVTSRPAGARRVIYSAGQLRSAASAACNSLTQH
jgi:hypothetical protein